MATRQRSSRSATATTLVTPLRTVDSFLWDAETLARQSGMFGQQLPGFLDGIKAQLQQMEIQLNVSQWIAWQRALAYRLTLVWGPPGTGKSQTMRALVAGIAIAARSLGQPMRVLISAVNYNAFDNILGDAAMWLNQHLSQPIALYRLRSSYGKSQVDPLLPIIDVENNATSSAIEGLLQALTKPSDVVIVAATPNQIFRLVTRDDNKGSPIDELFDFIIIDEASQMDTGMALPLICAASRNAQIVLAGDPMQLAPIAATPPPLDTEYLVGSIYSYLNL